MNEENPFKRLKIEARDEADSYYEKITVNSIARAIKEAAALGNYNVILPSEWIHGYDNMQKLKDVGFVIKEISVERIDVSWK